MRHARQLCRAGQIGTIRKVIVEYLQDFLCFPHEKHGQKQALWRVDPAQVGIAGTLGEAGVHCINLLEYVTGDRIASSAPIARRSFPIALLEEDANILLRLDGGGKGMLTVSQIATGEENNLRLRVYGSEAALLWEQENPNSLSIYRYGQPRQIVTRGHSEYLSHGRHRLHTVAHGTSGGLYRSLRHHLLRARSAIRRHIDGRPAGDLRVRLPHRAMTAFGCLEFTYKGVESL